MKYLSSILLTFITSCLLAQNPTYEETVDFIKVNCVGRMLYEGALDSYQRETGHKLTKIEIQKDGRIKLVADQQNGRHDFEIVFNIFDLKSSIDYPDGIRAYKFLVHFQGLNVSSGYGITFATDADAQRVARAFRHLKTMCSKGGGLFDASTQTEKKPTLNKIQTISYIKELLNNQTKLTYTEIKFSDYRYTGELTQTISNNMFNIDNSLTTYNMSDRQYEYSETEKVLSTNLLDIPIQSISLLDPNPVWGYDTDAWWRDNYCVKIIFTSKIKGITKFRECGDDNGNYWSSLSKAQNSCRSQSWENLSFVLEDFNIYIKNETDAKRLKKALEHLAALINEEENAEKENDPFGN